MDSILKQLTAALEKFEGSVKKEAAEVSKNRAAVQCLKDEITDTYRKGHVIRDNTRIVLSAPEIIIGNVDSHGELLGDSYGKVVVRGKDLSLEGAGSTGCITQRAPTVKTIAVDPGIDGNQNIVYATSDIVSQARNITIQSDDDKDCFANNAVAMPGVNILSDTMISVHSTPSCKIKKSNIEKTLADLQKRDGELTASASKYKATINGLVAGMEKLMEDQLKYNGDPMDICTNYQDLSVMKDNFKVMEGSLCSTVSKYVICLSERAEVNRQMTALKAAKQTLSTKEGSFATNAVHSAVSIEAEAVSIVGIDGDGNIRTNKESGLYVQMPHVAVDANDKEGKLIEDSTLSINNHDIVISSVNTQLDEKGEKGDYDAKGSITLTAKEITVEAVDKKLEDKKIKVKDQTAGGAFSVRAATIGMASIDKDGKSAGSLSLNAKNIKLASVDTDKESGKDKEMAKGSELILLSEKMRVGSTKSSNLAQIAAKKVAVIAKETAELNQDGKAVVTASGGNISAGGSKVELNGDTTIAGKADIKGDTTAPKGTFKNLEASTSFKSSNISDGIAVPAPATPGKPSPKMTEEEIQIGNG